MHTPTCFSLCSWYCQEFVPPPATPSNSKPNDVSPELLASRILIVDDERVNIVLLQAILARAGYSNVVATSNSREVASICQEEAPDLVLLDIMMPHRDGFGILEDLTPLREKKILPVLMLTADANPATRSRALRAGASAFLTKPLDIAQVLTLVQQLLQTTYYRRGM